MGRPTTPSWADFMSAGFHDEPTKGPAPLMLPPDKILPPINTQRGNSSQSHRRPSEADLEPGELASITRMELEECFWWVWITSLAGEEPNERKAVFGRCALIETTIRGGKWLVMEEKVKGAAPPPEEGAYIVEKKSRFGFTKRGKMSRSKLSTQQEALPRPPMVQPFHSTPAASKTSIGPDQHARIQAAAALLQKKQQQGGAMEALKRSQSEDIPTRTNSVFTLQPVIISEAAPALKWAKKFDRDAIREEYLGNNFAGKGSHVDLPHADGPTNGHRAATQLPPHPALQETEATPEPAREEKTLPAPPADVVDHHHHHHPRDDGAAQMPPPPAPKDEPPSWSSHAAPEQVPLPSDVADATAVASKPSSPDAKSKANKLRKGGAGGGFKKLFGRKKTDEPAAVSSAPEEPTTGLQAPRASLGRLSSFRRKDSSPSTSPHPAMPTRVDSGVPSNNTIPHDVVPEPEEPKQAVEEPSPPTAREAAPEPPPEPVQTPEPSVVMTTEGPVAAYKPERFAREPSPASPPTSSRPTRPAYQTPYHTAPLTPTQAAEEAEAARAFSSFSQGPMDDVPAFVPQDSPARSESPVASAPTPPVIAEPTRPMHAAPKAELPVARAEPTTTSRTDAGEPAELNRETAPELKDRWAQIRANAAASRAAAAQKKETVTPAANPVKPTLPTSTSTTSLGAAAQVALPASPAPVSSPAPASKPRGPAAADVNGEESMLITTSSIRIGC
jgi:hypothetical protein